VGGLVPFVVAAMQQSFSPAVIRAAFQKTGLVPYNRAILLNRASRFTKVISVPEQNKAGILAAELVFQRTAAAKPRGTVVHLAAPVELHELLLDEDVITLQQRRLDDEAEKAARAAARKVAQAAAKEEKLKARAERDRAKEERAKARAEIAAAKAKRAVTNRCRICHSVWRGGPLPTCDICGEWSVCMQHEDGVELVEEHELTCEAK
jgi:hypothetical protein